MLTGKVFNRYGELIYISRSFLLDELSWVTTYPENRSLLDKAVTKDMIDRYSPRVTLAWKDAYGAKDSDAAKEELNEIYWEWLNEIKELCPELKF